MLRAAVAAALLVAAVVMAWGIFAVVSARRLEQAKARWVASVGPLHPAPGTTVENARASEADAAARRLGFSLTLVSRVESARDDSRPQRLGAMRRYIDEEIGSAEPLVRPPSGELAAWLEQHRADACRLVDILEAGPAPQWQHLPSPDDGAPFPNMLGHLWTCRVLLVLALDETARGDEPAALRALDAAWRLRASLQAEPDLIATNIATTVGGELIGVLRRLRHVPDEWLPRLKSLDWGSDVVTALSRQAPGVLMPVESPEAWARELGESPLEVDLRFGPSFVEAPWRRLAVADELDAQRTLIENARRAPACASVSEAFDATLAETWPHRLDLPWQVDSRAFRHAAAGRFAADLTRETLLARKAAEAGDLADAVHDGSCPGWSWQVRVVEPRTLEISFVGDPPWPAGAEWATRMPLSHRERID